MPDRTLEWPPFFDLYCQMRNRLDVSLTDYIALLQAIDHGLAGGVTYAPDGSLHVGELEDLITVCQLLWAKQPADADYLERSIRRYVKKAKRAAYEAYSRQAQAADPLSTSHPDPLDPLQALPTVEPPDGARQASEIESLFERLADELTAAPERAPAAADLTPDDMPTVTLPPQPSLLSKIGVGDDVLSSAGGFMTDIPPDALLEFDELGMMPGAHLDFNLPQVLADHQIRQMLRAYELECNRQIAPVFDLRTTIAQGERHAGLLIPAFVRMPHKSSSLVLLIDVGAHMGAFSPQLSHLQQVIAATLPKRTTRYSYFKNRPRKRRSRQRHRNGYHAKYPDKRLNAPAVPGQPRADAHDPLTVWQFYEDSACKKPISLEDIYVALPKLSVLIISDAGALRQSHELEGPEMYTDAVCMFLRELYQLTPHVAWLNPMPKVRWAGTPAADLAQHVTMHYYDQRGLRLLLRTLSGQAVSVG
ncbi:MAG: hypothetical protein GYB67_03095 [Chloroflexi bacterium]|nr:hypothetical protein [Chloroflexota bacterium]